jgi:hypothetical protein
VGNGATGIESAKKQVSRQKRKLQFISNIYVIKDSAKPENEGKNFLYRYGKKINDKIEAMLTPAAAFEDEVPVDPFDFWTGANFRLKMSTVKEGNNEFPNYDKSAFDPVGPLFPVTKDMDEAAVEAKLEKLWAAEYSLQAFLAPSNYKSYDELKRRLDKVLGTDSNASVAKPSTTTLRDASHVHESASAATTLPWEADVAAVAAGTKNASVSTPTVTVAPDDDDDTLAMFQKMAEE